MLPLSSIQKINSQVPSIVQRARMGDQNALALITEVKNNRSFNEKAKYSYNSIVNYIKKNPYIKKVTNNSFNGDKENFYNKFNELSNKLSPMACAIILIPHIGFFNPKLISNFNLIFPYVKLISLYRNGNFPLIETELN